MIHIRRSADGDNSAQEVRPDVDGFVVQVEERAEGVDVGGADLAVPGVDEGVVTAPLGQFVPDLEKAVLGFLLD